MRRLLLLTVLVILQVTISCSSKKDEPTENIKTDHVTFSVTEEDIEPPPPNFRSSFQTLEEWLQHICSGEVPKQAIANFEFGMFESADANVLYLIGTNKYALTKYDEEIRIEYQPADMYFNLPKKEYGHLNGEQVKALLTKQLEAFTKTEIFQQSFLSKANTITAAFEGVLWSKP